MANKRQIKKQIHYACGALAAQCIIAAETVKDIDSKAMNEIILEIARLQANSLKRCSFIFDKSEKEFDTPHSYSKAKKTYNAEAFRILIKDFNEKVGEILHKMNSLLPAEQREANKAAASK